MRDWRLYLEGFAWTLLIASGVTIALAITGSVFPPLFNRSDTLAIIGIVLSKIIAVSIEDGLRYLGISRMRQRHNLLASAFVLALFIAMVENFQQFGRVSSGLAEAGEMVEPGLFLVALFVIGASRVLWHFTLCRFYVVFADHRAWTGVIFLFTFHVVTNSILAVLPFLAPTVVGALYWACALFLLAAGSVYGVCRNWPGLSRD